MVVKYTCISRGTAKRYNDYTNQHILTFLLLKWNMLPFIGFGTLNTKMAMRRL